MSVPCPTVLLWTKQPRSLTHCRPRLARPRRTRPWPNQRPASRQGPRVIADHVGLAILNPFRDHRVPWAAILTVDTGDWVQVHYALDGDATGAKTSAASRSISCWALYVSARTKRKAARPPRPRRSWFPSLPGGLDKDAGDQGTSRLPEEAKYLASLPPAKAIASRLDTRAEKERARGEHTGPVTAQIAWLPLAAVTVPALALLIIAIA